MRITAVMAGMLLFFVIFFAGGEEAKAFSLEETNNNRQSIFDETDVETNEQEILKQLVSVASEEPEVKESKKKEQPKKNTVYTVQAGDTLSSIAEKHSTSWERLFNKNEDLNNPNIISVGDEIVIPGPKEKLPNRQIPVVQPEPVVTPEPTTQVAEAPVAPAAPAPQPIAPQPAFPASSAGNTYYYGYCTWYAKSRRPDLPNNLGNADTWVALAAAQGIPTGSTPRVGAIGQQGMHVVYVEQVHANGTVTISEMNFNGWGVVSSRTVPASSFMYIY